LRPTFRLMKPKKEQTFSLQKTDKSLLDAMLSTGAIEDVKVYASTIANRRGISTESIEKAVDDYISL